MMEDFSDRTEAPTPRRREQFRRDGQVARSVDLSASGVLIAALLLLSVIGPHLVKVLQNLIKQALSAPLESSDPTKLFSTSASSVMLALAPLLLTVLGAGVVINLAQIGFPIGLRMPRKNRGQFNPTTSSRRLFTGFIKLAILGAVAYQVIASRLQTILTASHADFPRFVTLCIQLLMSAAMRLALVLLIFGLIDYAIQRYQLTQKLRMTRRELQEEQRSTDGDPKLRARRRQIARKNRMHRTPGKDQPA
jgi:flagellar biosynthetic protein FlhB